MIDVFLKNTLDMAFWDRRGGEDLSFEVRKINSNGWNRSAVL